MYIIGPVFLRVIKMEIMRKTQTQTRCLTESFSNGDTGKNSLLSLSLQAFYFVSVVVMSYAAAFVLAVCVELPTMRLENVLFFKAKISHTSLVNN